MEQKIITGYLKMLDEKKIREIKNRVVQYLKAGSIRKEESGRYVEFFLNNAKNSIDTAKLLYATSINDQLQKTLGFLKFNGFLWVINSSYYSMFYMTRALLEKEGIKIKTDFSVHAVTFDCLVYYFYLTGKLEKQFIEEFQEASEEAQNLLGKTKAKELMEDYLYEHDKRGRFTYEMGAIALENKAKTSLERAKKFNETIRKMVEL